jgi:predicted MFS family arabinose efflux permease
MTGTGVVAIIPALADLYGVPVGVAGLSITAYMAPFAVLQLFSGSVAEMLSGRRTAAAGFIVFALASLACALSPSFPLFLVFRLLQGVGGAFLFPILMAMIGEVVAPERLGRAIGMFGMTQTLGLAVGPLLAGLSEAHAGWRWFFVVLATLAAAALLGFLRLFPPERRGPPPARGVLATTVAVLGRLPVVLLSLAAAGLFFAMIGTYTYLGAALRTEARVSDDQIGMVLAVAGAVGIPVSPLAGRWVDRFGGKGVILVGLAGFVASLLVMAVAPHSLAVMIGLAAWLGAAGAVAWIGLNTLAIEIVPTARKPVAAVYNALRFVGYAAAPPLLGLVYARAGAPGAYVVSALVVVGSAACIAALPLPRRDGF